jgi:uncharacterized membrane protein
MPQLLNVTHQLRNWWHFAGVNNIITFSVTNRWRSFLVAAILVHFAVSLLLGLSRHWGYMSSINDLAHFDQAVWGAKTGYSLLNTDLFNKPTNRLGIHFDPILFLFVPLYAIKSNVMWFIIAQAFSLAMAAWLIFLLSAKVFSSQKLGLLWALTYLVNPFILNAAAWDFHPIVLAAPFVASSMLAIEMKKPYLLFASTFVILLCKEHFGVMAVGFGILWYIRNKSWKPALGLVLIGIMHSFIVLGVIMPALSATGHPFMLADRYSWLGHSMGEIIGRLFTDPFSIIKVVMIDYKGIIYILFLLAFFCGFPLLAPAFLLPGLADLTANMLSAVSMPRSPFAYHSVTLIPILTTAAIYGVKRLSLWQSRYTLTQLTGLAVIASLLGGYMYAPLPLPGAYNYWAPAHFLNLPDPRIQTIRSLVGKNASVSVQANVGSHFSQRHEIYRYPNMVGQVDAIILRLESPTKNINNLPVELMKNRRYNLQMLDSHLQMDRTEYIASIRSLLSDNKYGVLLWDDPWLVLAQGASSHGLEQKLEQKLNRLEEEWKIDSKEQ